MATSEMAHNRSGARLPQRLGLRVVLLIVVLIPTLGMATLAVLGSSAASERRAAAEHLRADTEDMLRIIEARAAIADEEVASSVLTVAANAGAGPEVLEDLYGVDYTAELAAARALVDGSPFLQSEPALVSPLQALAAARRGVDDGTLAFETLRVVIRDLTTAIDQVWLEQLTERSRVGAHNVLAADSRVRVDGLVVAYEALSAGTDLATVAVSMAVKTPTTDELTEALDSRTRYRTATGRFDRLFGPEGLAAWERHRGAAETESFEATLASIVQGALTRRPSPYEDDINAFGDAFIDGAAWGDSLTNVVRGAAADLDELTQANLTEADRDLWLIRGGATALAIISLVGAVLVARWVIRPVRSLQLAAQRIEQGLFDLDPIDPRGPRELSETAAAFNDMASTLTAVEAHAVALANDPGAPIHNEHLPGRTGRALHVALTRLRTSMQMAEEHRKELKRAATHDDLTGLLNRPAAIEVLERDLSRRARSGGAVAALFIDLDGLKPINDQYGHAAGDDALRLTAEAMAGAIRSTDVAARLGGDEFIVTANVHDVPDEVQALAERIHSEITSRRLACPDGYVPLRCSIGVAMADEGDDASTLIRKADAAMYLAKKAGKNQIAWYDEGLAPAVGETAAQPSP